MNLLSSISKDFLLIKSNKLVSSVDLIFNLSNEGLIFNIIYKLILNFFIRINYLESKNIFLIFL